MDALAGSSDGQREVLQQEGLETKPIAGKKPWRGILSFQQQVHYFTQDVGAIWVRAEVPGGHSAKFPLEQQSLRFRKSQEIPRRFQLEDQPVKDAPLLGHVGRVVNLARQREKLVVPVQAIKEASDPVGLLAPLQKADLNRMPVRMRAQARSRCSILIPSKQEDAGQPDFPMSKNQPGGL